MEPIVEPTAPAPLAPGDELILAADQMRNHGFLLLHVANKRSSTLHSSARMLMADLGVPEDLRDDAASRLVLRVTQLKDIFNKGRD